MAEQAINEQDAFIQKRYKEVIRYYWRSSVSNKKWYKITRILAVIFGALVTLVASLASSSYFKGNPFEVIFDILTPVLAALLTVIAGFSQSFQWGSAWQNMVLTAEKLQREFDIYLMTSPEQRDYVKEVAKLNNYVIKESNGFFEKMLGSVTDIEPQPSDKTPDGQV